MRVFLVVLLLAVAVFAAGQKSHTDNYDALLKKARGYAKQAQKNAPKPPRVVADQGPGGHIVEGPMMASPAEREAKSSPTSTAVVGPQTPGKGVANEPSKVGAIRPAGSSVAIQMTLRLTVILVLIGIVFWLWRQPKKA